jgi:hypothetical protein
VIFVKKKSAKIFQAEIAIQLDWVDPYLREGYHFFEDRQKNLKWARALLMDSSSFFNPTVYFENMLEADGIIEGQHSPPEIVGYVPKVIRETLYGRGSAGGTQGADISGNNSSSTRFQVAGKKNGGTDNGSGNNNGTATSNENDANNNGNVNANNSGTSSRNLTAQDYPLNGISSLVEAFQHDSTENSAQQFAPLWLTKRLLFKGEFSCTKLDARNFPLDMQRIILHLKAKEVGKAEHRS